MIKWETATRSSGQPIAYAGACGLCFNAKCLEWATEKPRWLISVCREWGAPGDRNECAFLCGDDCGTLFCVEGDTLDDAEAALLDGLRDELDRLLGWARQLSDDLKLGAPT